VIAGLIEKFRFLHYGLALILIFVGGKMLASNYVELRTEVALGTVALILLTAVGLSLVFPEPAER
jgi:tellurite resistance protein TerC